MQELTNRQLLDRELTRYTAAGWRIVSQSESSFQVVQPHVINANATGLLGVPIIFGVFISLFSAVLGTVLFWFTLLCAVLLVLNHLSTRSELLYITAEQLRTLAPASIEHNARGITVCSVCQTPTRADARACGSCKRYFGITPVFSDPDRACYGDSYQSAPKQLKAEPTNADYKQHTLQAGQTYSVWTHE